MCIRQLIHQGKVLKDGTTLEENKVLDNNFIVVMLSKTKSAGEGSTTSAAASTKAPGRSAPPVAAAPQPSPVSTVVSTPVSAAADPTPVIAAGSETGVCGQAASNLVAGNHLEEAVQQILDIGGGTWDRDTVIRALRAAFNNPERAVEYVYSASSAKGLSAKQMDLQSLQFGSRSGLLFPKKKKTFLACSLFYTLFTTKHYKPH